MDLPWRLESFLEVMELPTEIPRVRAFSEIQNRVCNQAFVVNARVFGVLGVHECRTYGDIVSGFGLRFAGFHVLSRLGVWLALVTPARNRLPAASFLVVGNPREGVPTPGFA